MCNNYKFKIIIRKYKIFFLFYLNKLQVVLSYFFLLNLEFFYFILSYKILVKSYLRCNILYSRVFCRLFFSCY